MINMGSTLQNITILVNFCTQEAIKGLVNMYLLMKCLIKSFRMIN
jgi:hypothetical protein